MNVSVLFPNFLSLFIFVCEKELCMGTDEKVICFTNTEDSFRSFFSPDLNIFFEMWLMINAYRHLDCRYVQCFHVHILGGKKYSKPGLVYMKSSNPD